ncbi:MAG: flagellar type III secretion system pore protein FliP [Endozoicomonadaceae bacterium]|nr:flagellar type III secretion system pore protein FliP [Endozoicomonadaceae bacterium]
MLATLILSLLPLVTWAAPDGMPLLTVTENGEHREYSATLQILLLMTAISFLPAALLMLTSFTRIIIVLAILRQAMGLQQTPPNRVLIGIALALTLLIMTPLFQDIYTSAVTPYLKEELSLLDAIQVAAVPLQSFMLSNTREIDLEQFLAIARIENLHGPEDVPFSVLVPSFITSELKTAFQIGFILFIPFLVIDLVVASVLMAMGMIMLSPQMISLPFKLMLFVLVDGWALTMGTLANSFN